MTDDKYTRDYPRMMFSAPQLKAVVSDSRLLGQYTMYAIRASDIYTKELTASSPL